MNIILGVKELASDLSGWISETPINWFELAGSEGQAIWEPSARWRYNRKHWPAFMRKTADHITGYLAHRDIRSVVPELLPQCGWRQLRHVHTAMSGRRDYAIRSR